MIETCLTYMLAPLYSQRINFQLGVVPPICNPSTRQAQAEGSLTEGWPSLHNKFQGSHRVIQHSKTEVKKDPDAKLFINYLNL